jgi:hypothetical protein
MKLLLRIQHWWNQLRHGPRESRPFALSQLQQWVDVRQFSWKPDLQAAGFVIEGRQGMLPWRLEWGAPQRAYFERCELRIRADLNVAPELHALLITRPLQERLEEEVFDHFVGDMQTRVDTRIPPEVRWLMIYSPLPASLSPALKQGWMGVSNVRPWMEAWLASPLGRELSATDVAAQAPTVLMIARSRLTLRMELAKPEVAEMERALHLFEAALREARRAGQTGCDSGDHDATQPGTFTSGPQVVEHAEMVEHIHI